MNLAERDEGDYRIYAGALEGQTGEGYIAAVVVSRIRNTTRPQSEAFRDVSLAGGHRWATADEALMFAVSKGREVVRTERHRLAC